MKCDYDRFMRVFKGPYRSLKGPLRSFKGPSRSIIVPIIGALEKVSM